jgi:hypothetical protein
MRLHSRVQPSDCSPIIIRRFSRTQHSKAAVEKEVRSEESAREIVEYIRTYLNSLYINSLCESDENCSHAWNINYHRTELIYARTDGCEVRSLVRIIEKFVRKTNMKLNSEHW